MELAGTAFLRRDLALRPHLLRLGASLAPQGTMNGRVELTSSTPAMI